MQMFGRWLSIILPNGPLNEAVPLCLDNQCFMTCCPSTFMNRRNAFLEVSQCSQYGRGFYIFANLYPDYVNLSAHVLEQLLQQEKQMIQPWPLGTGEQQGPLFVIGMLTNASLYIQPENGNIVLSCLLENLPEVKGYLLGTKNINGQRIIALSTLTQRWDFWEPLHPTRHFIPCLAGGNQGSNVQNPVGR